MKYTYTILFALLMTITAFGQSAYPTTHIYVMDMVRFGQDYFKFVNPVFVNSDNKNGYNNQPYFINDNELVVTSQRDGKQTDLYKYNFRNLKVTRLTNTENISEFSPMVIPGTKALSTVCIEEDGSTQRLWRYDFGKTLSRTPLMSKVKGVGYYEWISNRQAALFMVADPSRLEIGTISTQQTVRYATNIGRCIKKLNNGDLLFVKKSADGSSIKRFDIDNLDISTIAPTLTGSEDYAVLADNTIIMAKGDKLYKINADREKQWTLIGNFENFNIGNITRIAVTEDKIAIVASPR